MVIACLVFTSYSKRKIGHFDVLVVQRRQRNEEKKRNVRAICRCFVNLNLLLFLPFLLTSFVKLLNVLYASPTSVLIQWVKQLLRCFDNRFSKFSEPPTIQKRIKSRVHER